MSKPFYSKGIRFSCQQSGECCRSGRLHGYVYLSLPERRRIAKKLGLAAHVFTRRFTERDGTDIYLKQTKPHCPFLKGNKCAIHSARPLQCRTWPFWPENMKNAANWNKNVKKRCLGAGKGKLYTAGEIDRILSSQADA